MKRTLLATLLIACMWSCATATADWKLDEEHWYVVEIAGTRAGFMNTMVLTDGSNIQTATHMQMTLGRGAVATTIKISSAFEETADGRPLVISSMQEMGQQPVKSEWRFLEDDMVVHTSRQGGREIVRETEAPDGVWLTPMGVHRLWLKRVAAGDREISYFMVDGQTGLEPVEMTHTFVEDRVYEIDGRETPVSVWKTTTSLMPITGTEYYNAEGLKVYEEVSMPGLGKMVTRIATKAEAQGDGVAAGPEILIKTFVEPDRPIRDVGRATTATFRLRVDLGEMPELPSAAAQRVTPGDDGVSATLLIDINDSLVATAAEVGDASYLASSAMVDAGDPLVGKLAARAVRDAGQDTLARADAMRAAVHRYVTGKGLDTAFATASETARTRSGDCSEHAVLLCAMLRAEGIPARVAVGLVYADAFLGREAIFGWHMWTQALIDDRWVDLDATLRTRYHAGHVLTAVSNLEQGGVDTALASTLPLMGNLQIEVVDVGYKESQ
jgi:transglutaminase-like putative cysteine protease